MFARLPQTEFMRTNELPYTPLAPGAMDAELRAALAAVQRFKGEMEAANAVEQGGKDHQFYEVPSNCRARAIPDTHSAASHHCPPLMHALLSMMVLGVVV